MTTTRKPYEKTETETETGTLFPTDATHDVIPGAPWVLVDCNMSRPDDITRYDDIADIVEDVLVLYLARPGVSTEIALPDFALIYELGIINLNEESYDIFARPTDEYTRERLARDVRKFALLRARAAASK